MNQRENQIYGDVLEILRKELKPSKIILFGSRSKEKVRASSDFDFAIECDPVYNEAKMNIKNQIEEISGLYNIDIIYLDEVDNHFKEIILKTGKVVYER